MDDKNVGGRDRLVRLVLTAVLSIAAVRWLRNGKRVRGLLAGVGALGLGFNATTGYCGANDALDIDTTEEVPFEETAADGETGASGAESAETTTVELHCDICGEAIVPGQRRGPTEDGEIAHADCR